MTLTLSASDPHDGCTALHCIAVKGNTLHSCEVLLCCTELSSSCPAACPPAFLPSWTAHGLTYESLVSEQSGTACHRAHALGTVMMANSWSPSRGSRRAWGAEKRGGERGGGRGDGVDDAGENREATKQGSN